MNNNLNNTKVVDAPMIVVVHRWVKQELPVLVFADLMRSRIDERPVMVAFADDADALRFIGDVSAKGADSNGKATKIERVFEVDQYGNATPIRVDFVDGRLTLNREQPVKLGLEQG